jgi:hypothetical protein
MVATMPLPGRNEMARLIYEAREAAGPEQRAKVLEEMLNYAVMNGSVDTGSQTLPTFAATYAQIEIDRDSGRAETYNAVIATLRKIIAGVCAKGFMLPDDPAAQWFKEHGGIPAECR